MTPREVLAMVAAKREEQREGRRYLDMLQSRQTANTADMLFRCLHGVDIYPIDPAKLMAFDWDPQPITATTTEPEDDDEIDQELLMQQSQIMRGMLQRDKGVD